MGDQLGYPLIMLPSIDRSATWRLALCLAFSLPAAAHAEGLESLSGAWADGAAHIRSFRREFDSMQQAVEVWLYNPDRGTGYDQNEDLAPSAALEFDQLPGRKNLHRVANVEEVRIILREYADQGVRIRRLVIAAHGTPGFTTIFGVESVRRLEGLGRAFAPGAEITFRSCKVGDGFMGAEFLKRVGDTLLRANGGSVAGPRWYFLEIRTAAAKLIPAGAPLGYRRYIVTAGGQGRFEIPIDLEGLGESLLRGIESHERRLQARADRARVRLKDVPPGTLSALSFLAQAKAAASRRPLTLMDLDEAQETLQEALSPNRNREP